MFTYVSQYVKFNTILCIEYDSGNKIYILYATLADYVFGKRFLNTQKANFGFFNGFDIF